MKSILITIFVLISYHSHAEDNVKFKNEAISLVNDLKSNLQQKLTHQIQNNGVVSAIPFCHTNVKSIAKDSAKERINKYLFGRTSHKIRNDQNAPKDWMLPIIENFKNTTFNKDKIKDYEVLGKLKNGKHYYAEPLFVQAQCLSCHGENLNKDVSEKINLFYPKDQATGFKQGEFRGIIWVLEK